MLESLVVNLNSIAFDSDDINEINVKYLLEAAEEMGFLFPPLLICKTSENEYSLIAGDSHLEAAKRLHNADPENWKDTVLCSLIEHEHLNYRLLSEQVEIF